MQKLLLGLALLGGAALAHPAVAQISKFHGDIGLGAVLLHAAGPVNNNPYGYSGVENGYVIKTYDATIMLLDWHGAHEQERSVVSGADPDRASDSLD